MAEPDRPTFSDLLQKRMNSGQTATDYGPNVPSAPTGMADADAADQNMQLTEAANNKNITGQDDAKVQMEAVAQMMHHAAQGHEGDAANCPDCGTTMATTQAPSQ